MFLLCFARAKRSFVEIHRAQAEEECFGERMERLLIAPVHNLIVVHHRHLPAWAMYEPLLG